MEITLAMRVLDALASQLEALKERVEMAEAHIKELQKTECASCVQKERKNDSGAA